MFHAKDGLSFEKGPDGSVTVYYANGAPGITLDDGTWASVIAQMSYYGEEDYGWYRAVNFHRGTPIPETCPLVEKQPQ